MKIITCIIWLQSFDLLLYIIIIISLQQHYFLVLTCVILSLYRSKRRPPDSEWGGHWEHSQPWKILIINIALLSLLLLLSLSLLLKMNGEDTRGIVGKSVWNSTCRNLEEKVASIIFVIFKTAHIYKWVDAMQCSMYQKEGHWVSKQVTVWFISFTAQLSLLWLPECPIKDRHWCKRPNF